MTEYSISEQAFIEANMHVNRKRVWMSTGLALILTWLFFYLFQPVRFDVIVLSIASVMAILIFRWGIPVLQRFGYRKTYLKNPMFLQKQAFLIDGEGIQLKSERGEVRYHRCDLIKVEETANLILLFPTTQIFHIIPKELLGEQELNYLLGKG